MNFHKPTASHANGQLGCRHFQSPAASGQLQGCLVLQGARRCSECRGCPVSFSGGLQTGRSYCANHKRCCSIAWVDARFLAIECPVASVPRRLVHFWAGLLESQIGFCLIWAGKIAVSVHGGLCSEICRLASPPVWDTATGHGMSGGSMRSERNGFTNRWTTIGSESKSGQNVGDSRKRFGFASTIQKLRIRVLPLELIFPRLKLANTSALSGCSRPFRSSAFCFNGCFSGCAEKVGAFFPGARFDGTGHLATGLATG